MNDQKNAPAQERTYGMKQVSAQFNPSGLEQVNEVKKRTSDLIDYLDKLRENATDGEVKRQLSVAITETKTASMWAVSALTYNL